MKEEAVSTQLSEFEDDTKVERNDSKNQDESSDVQTPSKPVLVSCLLSLTLIIFLMAIDVLIVGTIIDQVSKDFGDYSKTGWLVTGYSLPNSLLSLVWGRIANVIGLKISLSLCVLIFEIGSLVSALSQNMNTLIGGRVISGIGGSGIQTLTIVIGCSMVSQRSRPIVISILMSAFAVASVVGPIIGGAFTTHVTWRWCFWINLPIGGFAAAVFLVCYNPQKKSLLKQWTDGFVKFKRVIFPPAGERKSFREVAVYTWFTFDIGGLVLSCLGLVLFLLGLSFGGGAHPWKSGIVIAFMVVGGIVFLLSLVYDFVIYNKINPKREVRTYRPLLSWDIISKAAVFTASMVTFFMTMSYNGQMIYSVQFFQIIFHSSAWKAGLHLIPIVISSVFSAMIGGGITKKTGNVKYVLLFGSAIGVVGSGLMLIMDNHSTSHTQIGVLILPGVSLGAGLQAALVGSQLVADTNSPNAQSDFVEITAINSYMKSLGATFGGILSTTVFGTSAHTLIKRHKVTDYLGLPVDQIVPHRLENFDGPHTRIADLLTQSVQNVFWMDLIFSGLAFLFSIGTTNKTVPVQKKKVKDKTEISTDSEVVDA